MREDTDTHISWRGMARIGGIVGLSLTLFALVSVSQPGPTTLWVTDACYDDPTVYCGQVPMGPLLGGIGGFFASYLAVEGSVSAYHKLEGL